MGVIGKQEQKPVRGILVAGDFHPRLVFAAQAVQAAINGKPVKATFTQDKNRLVVTLAADAMLQAGDRLEVVLR